MVTHLGRVVYDKPKHYFTWKATGRIIHSLWLDAPEKEESVKNYFFVVDSISSSLYHQFRLGEVYIRGSEGLSRYCYTVCSGLVVSASQIARYMPESIAPQVKAALKNLLRSIISAI